MKYIQLQTPCGQIKGLNSENCYEFRGIRYATAERFEYPQEVTSWDGVYSALQYGNCACQHRAFDDDATVNAFYHKEFRRGIEFTYGEDCLFLNIYTPKKADKCPIIIYIHGGSFTGGSANEGHISGENFAQNGIITVTINYRLGAFGFCSLPELSQGGAVGNFGLFDQTAAIKWVKNNIEAFGGDSENIVLMGQSAGAMSVDIHLSNPLVRDMISGAIMISGAGLQRLLLRPLTPDKTVSFWKKVMKNAGVQSAEELRTLHEEKLYRAWDKACKESKLSIVYTMPVYDGVILKKGQFSKEDILDIPCIISSTATDMMPSVLNTIIKKWSNYSKKHHKNKCYVYRFDRLLPGDDKGAWHCCDLLYAFSTLDFSWRPFEKVDEKISYQLSQSICAFAKNGDPNCDAIPTWKSGIENMMHFSEYTAEF